MKRKQQQQQQPILQMFAGVRPQILHGNNFQV